MSFSSGNIIFICLILSLPAFCVCFLWNLLASYYASWIDRLPFKTFSLLLWKFVALSKILYQLCFSSVLSIDFQAVFLVVGKASPPSSPFATTGVSRSAAFLTFTGPNGLASHIVTLCRHSSVSQLHVLHQFSIFRKFGGLFSLPLSPCQFSCHLYFLTVILTDIWGVPSATFNWKLAPFILHFYFFVLIHLQISWVLLLVIVHSFQLFMLLPPNKHKHGSVSQKRH